MTSGTVGGTKGVDYQITNVNFSDYLTNNCAAITCKAENKAGYHNPAWYNKCVLRDLAQFARRRKRKRVRRTSRE